jgi:hypothetical protein
MPRLPPQQPITTLARIDSFPSAALEIAVQEGDKAELEDRAPPAVISARQLVRSLEEHVVLSTQPIMSTLDMHSSLVQCYYWQDKH